MYLTQQFTSKSKITMTNFLFMFPYESFACNCRAEYADKSSHFRFLFDDLQRSSQCCGVESPLGAIHKPRGHNFRVLYPFFIISFPAFGPFCTRAQPRQETSRDSFHVVFEFRAIK